MQPPTLTRIPNRRQQAADAHRIANDLAHDFVAGVKSYDLLVTDIEINQRLTTSESFGATRLCLFHLALCLAKYAEFYEHYKGLLPDEVRLACLTIYREVQVRGAVNFRNVIAGHVWDKTTRRPIPTAAMMDRLSDLLGGHIKKFLEWVGRADVDDGFPTTVVSVLVRTRDRVGEVYQLTPQDMIDHQFQFPRV
jgi:hypothetical protein